MRERDATGTGIAAQATAAEDRPSSGPTRTRSPPQRPPTSAARFHVARSPPASGSRRWRSHPGPGAGCPGEAAAQPSSSLPPAASAGSPVESKAARAGAAPRRTGRLARSPGHLNPSRAAPPPEDFRLARPCALSTALSTRFRLRWPNPRRRVSALPRVTSSAALAATARLRRARGAPGLFLDRGRPPPRIASAPAWQVEFYAGRSDDNDAGPALNVIGRRDGAVSSDRA